MLLYFNKMPFLHLSRWWKLPAVCGTFYNFNPRTHVSLQFWNIFLIIIFWNTDSPTLPLFYSSQMPCKDILEALSHSPFFFNCSFFLKFFLNFYQIWFYNFSPFLMKIILSFISLSILNILMSMFYSDYFMK